MNSANGGNIIYHFKGDTSGLDKASKSAEGKLKGLGAGGKTALLGVAAAATTATAAIVSVTKDSVKAYAAVEQSIGGVETLFKESADIVIANAKKAYETAGVDANTYMEQVTSFSASLLQSLGGDTKKAADVADMAIRDMADNSNKMGTSMEAIQNAYQGFAKQNYTMLDNLKLGYGGTKTEMERLLADAEKLSGVHYDISNLNDVYQAIHVIQEDLDITGTTAKEASSTITGSINAAKSAYQNFLSGQGGIEQVITTFVTAGKNIAAAIMKMLPQLVQGIVGLINGLIPLFPTLIKELLPSIISGAIELIKGVIAILPDLLTMIAEILPDQMPIIVDAILQIIPMLIDMMPLFIEAGAKILAALIEGLIKSLPKLLSNGKKIAKGLLNVFTFYPTIEWLNDGISVESMKTYNILYSISENKIIIPHYNLNGELIGIRGRALNEEDLILGKYMPVKIENITYAHPLGYNLYGLNFVKENVKKYKTAIIAEGEKSCLQYSTMFGQDRNIVVATCGSSFHKY